MAIVATMHKAGSYNDKDRLVPYIRRTKASTMPIGP